MIIYIYRCWPKRKSLSKSPLFLPNSLISQRLSHFPPGFGFANLSSVCQAWVRQVREFLDSLDSGSEFFSYGIVQNRGERNTTTQKHQKNKLISGEDFRQLYYVGFVFLFSIFWSYFATLYFVFCFGDFCSYFGPWKNSSKTTNQNNWKPHSLGVKRIEVRNMVFSWIFSNFLSWFGWLDCKNLII